MTRKEKVELILSMVVVVPILAGMVFFGARGCLEERREKKLILKEFHRKLRENPEQLLLEIEQMKEELEEFTAVFDEYNKAEEEVYGNLADAMLAEYKYQMSSEKYEAVRAKLIEELKARISFEW